MVAICSSGQYVLDELSSELVRHNLRVDWKDSEGWYDNPKDLRQAGLCTIDLVEEKFATSISTQSLLMWLADDDISDANVLLFGHGDDYKSQALAMTNDRFFFHQFDEPLDLFEVACLARASELMSSPWDYTTTMLSEAFRARGRQWIFIEYLLAVRHRNTYPCEDHLVTELHAHANDLSREPRVHVIEKHAYRSFWKL